ncbi:DUF4955 domain-containing protein [Carboxylicivirga sp. A043]|nr:DUF4955 domain-containing protein [Carboxylicivirga sp. A043]MCU4157147.1 DUF4955 domain-containing protein [Carboxylicivirga sp. A043]
MRTKLLTGALFVVLCCINAQESQIWQAFVDAKENGKELPLPDFSYAGYQCGEKAIPDIEAKVFNVTDFGAVPNDKLSDKEAIRKAINAAVKNGSGVIYFPAGRFLVNEKTDDDKPIIIKGKNIVFRGAGPNEGETELYMSEHLPPKDPAKLWTTPYMFQFIGGGKEVKLTDVTGSCSMGDFALKVKSTAGIEAGNWVVLRVKNNAPDLIESEMCGCQVDDKWTSILNKGIYVNEYHQVEKVKGKTIFFKEPILRKVNHKHNWELLSYANYEEVGVESICFSGNWHDKFVHHKDCLHDGGYSLLKFQRLANSWVQNCRFHNVNRAVNVVLSANVSVLNCTVTGTPGHSSISSNASSRVLIGKINDSSSQWHAPGVTSATIGTVLWRVKYNEDTSFETHASQPRATLFDCVEGGFFLGRGGGARHNLPNHMEYLVLWNLKS